MCSPYVIIHICDIYMAHTHTHGNIRQVVRNISDCEGFGSLPSSIFGICDKRKPNRWVNITPRTILFLQNMGKTI